jgi:hypothetical protein
LMRRIKRFTSAGLSSVAMGMERFYRGRAVLIKLELLRLCGGCRGPCAVRPLAALVRSRATLWGSSARLCLDGYGSSWGLDRVCAREAFSS